MTPLVGPDGVTPISTEQGELETVSPFHVSIVFSRQTGLGAVKMRDLDGTRAFLMTPLEARMLGADLIVKSEGALCNAITMRILTEPSMGNMPIEQAVETVDVLGRATRQAHTLAELEHQRAKREKQDNGQDTKQ